MSLRYSDQIKQHASATARLELKLACLQDECRKPPQTHAGVQTDAACETDGMIHFAGDSSRKAGHRHGPGKHGWNDGQVQSVEWERVCMGLEDMLAHAYAGNPNPRGHANEIAAISAELAQTKLELEGVRSHWVEPGDAEERRATRVGNSQEDV